MRGRRLRWLADRLSRRDGELRRLVATAENVRATLQLERERRSRLVAELTRRSELNNAELTRAEAGRARSLAGAASHADDIDATETTSAARTLVVAATGYAATGATASGVPAGPGVVAVDPSVIPLGTRLTIPGYGEGVAADTGTAVQGAVIDVWFATDAEARAWGRRTVAVVLH